MLKVMEIFDSIDGEGIRTGELTTFVRFAGCNLHCAWPCDTEYSINPKPDMYTEMTPEELANKIKYHNVTITGGEPLLQNPDDLEKLFRILHEEGKDVNVETNGTMDWHRYEDWIDHVTVDYKCLSSKMTKRMNPKAFDGLGDLDVIKCVVASEADMEDALTFIEKLDTNAWVYWSPAWGFDGAKIVEFMKQNNLQRNHRVQVQLHKYFWEPDARLV